MPTSSQAPVADRDLLLQRYAQVRDRTEALAAPLSPEDQTVQSMPDVSPTKWHRAHTTWFFETFVLGPHLAGYQTVHPAYDYLFNSYYEQVGDRHPRPERGLISRPSAEEVGEYRAAVDRALDDLIDGADANLLATILPLLELGTNHEQQHQELLLMDIKHVFSCNPLLPAYRLGTAPLSGPASEPLRWIDVSPDPIQDLGVDPGPFSFDNEGPRHQALVRPFRLADRLATEGEWLAFMEDGGYRRAELWLSEGWATVQAQGWSAPLYWHQVEDQWQVFTLGGARPLLEATPVTHVSYFEADAFARWSGDRLPTEAEWEAAAHQGASRGFRWGDVWEWTATTFRPYPGFAPGPLRDYSQAAFGTHKVLRGASFATRSRVRSAKFRHFALPDRDDLFCGFRSCAL